MISVAVIGETCTDEYVYGSCDRVCPEAAALCFRNNNHKTSNRGMAGNVYENIKALDKNNSLNIDLITCTNPIIKRRFIDTKYNSIVFREDINDTCEKINISNINLSKYNYIVISDYCKGFLDTEDIETIIQQAHAYYATVFIDTKKIFNQYISNADFIKVNFKEYSSNIENTHYLSKKTTLIVTDGDNGAFAYRDGIKSIHPTSKVSLRDVCGAGDTFLAAFVFDYIQSQNTDIAISFANLCSSKVVSKFGVCVP